MSSENWPYLSLVPPPAAFQPEQALVGQPPISGVYLLWDLSGALVYCGQSSHIARRLEEHRKERRHDFHHATWTPVVLLSDRLRIEGILILAANPPDNRALSLGLAPAGRVWAADYTFGARRSPAVQRRPSKTQRRPARKTAIPRPKTRLGERP